MGIRKSKTYSEIRDEIDDLIYKRGKKELDAFFNERESKKITRKKQKNVANYKIGDLLFVIFYFLVYFILLVIFLIVTPINLDANLKEIILWDKFVWILIYAIGVPITYLAVRNKYNNKNL